MQWLEKDHLMNWNLIMLVFRKKNNETALANFVEETMATVDTFGACVVLMHINILIIMRLFWDFWFVSQCQHSLALTFTQNQPCNHLDFWINIWSLRFLAKQIANTYKRNMHNLEIRIKTFSKQLRQWNHDISNNFQENGQYITSHED